VGLSRPIFGSTHGYAAMWPVIGIPVLLAAFLLARLERDEFPDGTPS
jgi:hypothetical protein